MLRTNPVPPGDLKNVWEILDKVGENVRSATTAPIREGLIAGIQHWSSNWSAHVSTLEGRGSKDEFLFELIAMARVASAMPEVQSKCGDIIKTADDFRSSLGTRSVLQDVVDSIGTFNTTDGAKNIQKCVAAAVAEKAVVDETAQDFAMVEPVRQFIGTRLTELEEKGPTMKFADMDLVLCVVESVLHIFGEGSAYRKEVGPNVDGWRALASMVAVTEDECLMTSAEFEERSFIHRKAEVAKMIRLFEGATAALNTITTEPAKWADPLEKLSHRIDHLGNVDSTAARDEVNKKVDELTVFLKPYLKDAWTEKFPTNGQWDLLVEHAKSPGGIIELDGKKADQDIDNLARSFAECESRWAFYSLDLNPEVKETATALIKDAVKVVATGCLIAGLASAKSTNEARRVAAKQLKRLKKHDMCFDDLKPLAMAKVAKQAFEYNFP